MFEPSSRLRHTCVSVRAAACVRARMRTRTRMRARVRARLYVRVHVRACVCHASSVSWLSSVRVPPLRKKKNSENTRNCTKFLMMYLCVRVWVCLCALLWGGCVGVCVLARVCVCACVCLCLCGARVCGRPYARAGALHCARVRVHARTRSVPSFRSLLKLEQQGRCVNRRPVELVEVAVSRRVAKVLHRRLVA